MKQTVSILLSVMLCIFAFFPITTYAETYHLDDTDISISVDNTSWYVFTRDNLKNNLELEELGISYDTMYSILQDNQAYMDAILCYEDGEFVELFIRKKAVDSGVANLSNYSNEEVLELAKELAKRQNAKKYSVYENRYKFAKLEYIDSTLDYNICEFVTVVNKESYTLTFQSISKFSDSQYEEMMNIVDSVGFDVDASLKEKKATSFWDNVITKTIGAAIIGGLIGAVIILANKKKKGRIIDEVASLDNTNI